MSSLEVLKNNGRYHTWLKAMEARYGSKVTRSFGIIGIFASPFCNY
jgi:hypothetical protein